MHREDFSIVFLPRSYGELVKADVEKLDGAIASCDEHLVLMGFGPGKVIQGVLRVEAMKV